MLEMVLIYYLIAIYGLSSLLKDVEENKVDNLSFNFSDSDYGLGVDSDNNVVLEGFGSPAAFGTWMHLKILETKTIAYLACYLRISKAILLFVNLKGPNTFRATMLQSTMRLRRTWSIVGVLQLGASYMGHQHIFHTGLQPRTSIRIMPAVGGKNIKDLLGPFLSNIEGATLLEAFLMHQEGLNLDKQYLLHLDLTIECAMADVASVDLPLYIKSALLQQHQ
ncbi:hypothetical protein SELMODRAFT_420538 [Selaginella moellendorffii]|uniref:Uncharacterized protein n=1 Tax=Selaginella moellendorffii TaxID=88036 RepID=D8SCB5_SELML|nr:hypothetical protein SELMODRAFT_420538 [Selaginella moellendorffii]